MTTHWIVFVFFAGLLVLLAGALGIRFAGRRTTVHRARRDDVGLFILDQTGDE